MSHRESFKKEMDTQMRDGQHSEHLFYLIVDTLLCLEFCAVTLTSQSTRRCAQASKCEQFS